MMLSPGNAPTESNRHRSKKQSQTLSESLFCEILLSCNSQLTNIIRCNSSYDQQRIIEDELISCDKKIQAIMCGGVGDCLGLKLEAVINCCNEISQQDNLEAQEHAELHGDRSLPLLGKSLSEAQLTLRKACQELDDICLSNNWMLPSYRTTRSDGGYVANVSVKGTNFECSGVSGIQPSIHEARNSAATHVIAKLQQMASEHNSAPL